MLRDVGAMFKARMQLKSIEYVLETELDDEEYMFDPARVSQILLNLISNSIKFTGDVLGVRRITVAAAVCDERPFVLEGDNDKGCFLHFAVTDTGPGLSEDESKLLFHRFSQCTPKTHIKYGGTGLGTFISRRLTELQGGQIRCVSRRGEGATFEFYIRTQLAEKMPSRTSRAGSNVSDHMLQAIATSIKIPDPPKTSNTTHKILVVEDNLLNQKLLVKQLTTSGHDVLVANNGREALDQIQNHPGIDLVLLDREMPVLNGYECLQELRHSELGSDRHLPVIAISANARAEQIEEMLSAGADGYITKPFRFADLKLKIAQYLN